MPYPVGITTRTVTLGGATALESAEPLILQAIIQSSRGLIWSATGWRFPSLARTVTSTAGAEITVELPVTDLPGWRLIDAEGSILDVSVPGSYTHTYTVTLIALTAANKIVSQRILGPFALPTGDGSPVDLDTLLPGGTVAGGVVLVPDTWGPLVVAAEAAAVESATNATPVTGRVRSLVATDGTDQTATIQAEIDALMAAGGGTLELPEGTITLDGTLTLVNDGATPPKQAPLRIVGQGAHWSGRGTTPIGGTILDIKGADTYGKIKTRGLGLLTLTGLTIRDTSGGTTPLLYTTNTTLHVYECAFVGSKIGAACDQDAIICGGTVNIEGAGDWTHGFQGYGTVIERNFFSGVRRCVYGRTYFNANVIRGNTTWTTCGNTGGAAYELDGDSLGTAGGSYSVGNVIADNLIELPYYKWGIRLRYAASNTLRHNNFFDAIRGSTLAAIRVESVALDNQVLEGFTDNRTIPIDDQSGLTLMQALSGGVWSRMPNKVLLRGESLLAAETSYAMGHRVANRTGDAAALWVEPGTNPYPSIYIAGWPGKKVADATTTLDSDTVTSATAAFAVSHIGRPIYGTGIPAGALIAAVVSPSEVTISKRATATATGVTVTFMDPNVAAQQLIRLERSHVVATGASPTVAVAAAAGTGATVSAAALDLAGTITLTTGSAPTAGTMVNITAAITWTGTQHIIVSPANAAAAALGVWAERASSSLLRVNVANAPAASTVYKFSYVVIQAA